MSQLEPCFIKPGLVLNASATQVVNQVVQDLCKKVIQTSCFENRQRSGSVPSQKKNKQIDVQSVSTMAGTFPSHKSDKRIQDLDSKHIQIKVPQSKKDPECKQQGKEIIWSLDKNGYIVSLSLDITTIKYYFIKAATKFGMIVMRDLQDIITVKTQRIESMKCLFMMCLPLTSDRSVYQLERYRCAKGSKIRLSLISGIQSKFDQFKKSFFYQLWNKEVLRLSNFQALNLLCFANKNVVSQAVCSYQKACAQFQIKNLATDQQIQNWQMSLLRLFKRSQQNIKQVVFTEKKNKIQKSTTNEIMIQRILINQIPIGQFYIKLKMQASKGLLQKKKKLIQSYSIKRVFQYLQIDLKLINEKHLRNEKPIEQINVDSLPYYQAVQQLDELNIFLSPLQNIKKISRFGQKLLECFQAQSGISEQYMDMDSQLPLTIYCCLISKNTQLKPIIALLHDYFEPEDDFQSQNRILAAVKAGLQYIRQQWSLAPTKQKSSDK